MFENVVKFFKKLGKEKETVSKDTAKERLHLVLMQDRANVSADFLDLMKQEIIDVIKKYIDVDENSIDVKLTNKTNSDGTNGAPILYANIPIVSIKDENKNKVIAENKQKENEENKEQEEVVEPVAKEVKEEKDENKEEQEEVKVEEIAAENTTEVEPEEVKEEENNTDSEVKEEEQQEEVKEQEEVRE